MKRLAINALLSATALAWSGAAIPASDKHPQFSTAATAPLAAQQLLFSAADRARLASWWQRWRQPAALPPIQPGQRLTFELMSAGRTVPQMLQSPQCLQAGLVDVLAAGQLLRVHRASRVVVDVLG